MIAVLNEAYRGLFLMFAFKYITESHTVTTINDLARAVEAEATKVGLPKLV